MTKKRYSVVLLIAVAVSLSACKGGKGGWGGGFKMPPTAVETAVVKSQNIADRFETVGTIEAADAVTVVSEIAGLVTSIPFREGGMISRGDVIARLDDTELKAEYDRVTAVKDQSKANYDRVKTVVEQGAGAPQDLDDAAAALKVAEANVASAKARLDKTRITAPFNGIVGARRISTGAYLKPGDAITSLASVQELRVNFSVPERYLAQLKRGSEVSVSTTAYPGYSLKGQIDVIEPTLDPGTRSAKVVAKVKNPEGKFKPGMSANISAVLGERADALTISNEAVFSDQNQSYVYVIKPDSTVAKVAVQLGSRTADAVEVTNGLHEGDRVVSAGHQKIYEGAKVIPVSSHDSTSTGAMNGSGAKP